MSGRRNEARRTVVMRVDFCGAESLAREIYFVVFCTRIIDLFLTLAPPHPALSLAAALAVPRSYGTTEGTHFFTVTKRAHQLVSHDTTRSTRPVVKRVASSQI